MSVVQEKMRRYFDDALAAQGAARRRKEEIALEAKCADVREEYIVAIYFHEQMSSPRCWRTQERADFFYKALKSETARLRAVKEQILIRYLGCGWDEAYHPWSEGGKTFTSSYLFKFLKETVIPLEEIKGGVPGEPRLSLPLPPKMGKMGRRLS